MTRAKPGRGRPAGEIQTPPSGGRFGFGWTEGSVLILLLAVLARAPWLAALALLIVVVGLSSRAWAALALRRVHLDLALSSSRVFVGETVGLTVTLANDKPLPLGWLKARVELPGRIRVRGARLGPSDLPGSQVLGLLTALRPYQRLVWR